VSAAAAAVALPVSAFLVWALLRSPLALRLIARPTGERWSPHATPTFGGVGLFLGFAAGIAVALAAGALEPQWELAGILGGAVLLFAAGLVDDVWSLPPAAKVAAQLAAAGIALSSGLSVRVVETRWVAIPLGLLWFIGMTNAFNLLDNMDGLAASLAALAAAFFAVDAVTLHPDRLSLVVALALALACVGFLPFNLRAQGPAAVFMGDSGSQVLGFALASLGMATSWQAAETTAATLVLPLLVLAIPILDTALVTVLRLVEGRPISQGGRDHTSHRLVRGGLSEKRTVILLAAIAAALGTSSLTYSVLNDYRLTLVGVLLTVALLVQFAGFLADLERGEVAQTQAGPPLLRTILLQRRRLAEVGVDFAVITASFYAAYELAVTGSGTPYQRHIFLVSLPAILVARYVSFIPLGLYRGVWRYAGARDAIAVVAGVVVSEAVAYGIVVVAQPLGDFPASIYVIDALICIVLVGATRFGERALFRALSSLKDRSGRHRTLIVGAGRSGRSLLRELRETPGEHVVGFVDDDPRLRHRRLQGVPVYGSAVELERVLRKTQPDTVLVTIPDAPPDLLDTVVRACADAEVPCRFVRRQLDLDPLAVLAGRS